jgi:hypothetical protein
VTVVHLAAVRKQRQSALSHFWQPEEIAELMRLYASLKRGGKGADYEYGETERHEPQFYVLNADLAQPCLSCVSRISKDSRPWYVVEDGSGGLLAEGDCLGVIVNQAVRLDRSVSCGLPIVTPILGYLLESDVFSAENLDVVMDLCLALA